MAKRKRPSVLSKVKAKAKAKAPAPQHTAAARAPMQILGDYLVRRINETQLVVKVLFPKA